MRWQTILALRLDVMPQARPVARAVRRLRLADHRSRERAALHTIDAHGRYCRRRVRARGHSHERHIRRARPVQATVREHTARVGILVARHVSHLHRVVAARILRPLDDQVGRTRRVVGIVNLKEVERRIRREAKSQRVTVAPRRPCLQVWHAVQQLHFRRPHRAETIVRRRLAECRRGQLLDQLQICKPTRRLRCQLCRVASQLVRIVSPQHEIRHGTVEPHAICCPQRVPAGRQVHRELRLLACQLLLVSANHFPRLVAHAVRQARDIASRRTRRLYNQLARRVRQRIAAPRRQLDH